MKDSHPRSIVKGITWRALGTIDTIVLSFIVTGNIEHSLKIGLTEVITKITLYYFHERIWNIIPLGRMESGPTHGRSLLKGVTWRAVGTLDTILIAYVITGVPINALTIGGFEVFTKIGFFYLHERIWSKLKWGRIVNDISIIQPPLNEVSEKMIFPDESKPKEVLLKQPKFSIRSFSKN